MILISFRRAVTSPFASVISKPFIIVTLSFMSFEHWPHTILYMDLMDCFRLLSSRIHCLMRSL